MTQTRIQIISKLTLDLTEVLEQICKLRESIQQELEAMDKGLVSSEIGARLQKTIDDLDDSEMNIQQSIDKLSNAQDN